jgi:hypothetical protein
MPFECEAEVGPDGPLLAVSVGIDLAVELLIKMDDLPKKQGDSNAHGMYAMPLTPALSQATERVLDCLASHADHRVLGPQLTREIIYRVLCGESTGTISAPW